MPECGTPVWPCSTAGAAACLAGFDDIAVIIHGSSGCFYYPASLIHRPLRGTFLLGDEAVFGGEDRLREVVEEVSREGRRIAVVTTCVPAANGDDVIGVLKGTEAILVESPGYLGTYDNGYRAALRLLPIKAYPGTPIEVTLDGISLADPFWRGNIAESRRILGMIGVSIRAVLASGRLSSTTRVPECVVQTNPDCAWEGGVPAGSLLGLNNTQDLVCNLASRIPGVDPEPVIRELDDANDRIGHACDKYLRRHSPPRVVIAGGWSYAHTVARMLSDHLDADIRMIVSRNRAGIGKFPVTESADLEVIRDILIPETPNLVVGSSFEEALCPEAAFVGIIPPLRGRPRLRSTPLVGTEGALGFMEEVLNRLIVQDI